MLRATHHAGGPALTITASVAGLTVYLDNWAVIELAKHNPERRRRFVNAVRSGIDLLFSVTNVSELIGPKGKSFDAVQSFLNEIGPFWVPVELNPFKVIERERKGLGAESCVAEDFMREYVRERTRSYLKGSGPIIDVSDDFFRLGAVMDWISQADVLRLRSAEFDDVLRKIRTRTNPPWLDRSFREFNPSARTTFTCFNLLKTLIVESKQYAIKKGDGLDFCHASIASAFASFAALDKNWKRRVDDMPKPNRLARTYYGPELDSMVGDMEYALATR
jgi:hypothetical protein